MVKIERKLNRKQQRNKIKPGVSLLKKINRIYDISSKTNGGTKNHYLEFKMLCYYRFYIDSIDPCHYIVYIVLMMGGVENSFMPTNPQIRLGSNRPALCLLAWYDLKWESPLSRKTPGWPNAKLWGYMWRINEQQAVLRTVKKYSNPHGWSNILQRSHRQIRFLNNFELRLLP